VAVFMGHIPLLLSNQQRQSTKGIGGCSEVNRDQLSVSLTNPRDTLHHGERAGERSV